VVEGGVNHGVGRRCHLAQDIEIVECASDDAHAGCGKVSRLVPVARQSCDLMAGFQKFVGDG
jgi:hypothetical protein